MDSSTFYTTGELFSSLCGTPFYLAPEVLLKKYAPRATFGALG